MVKKLMNGMFSSISDAELFAASLASEDEQATETTPGTTANTFSDNLSATENQSEINHSIQPQEPANEHSYRDSFANKQTE